MSVCVCVCDCVVCECMCVCVLVAMVTGLKRDGRAIARFLSLSLADGK